MFPEIVTGTAEETTQWTKRVEDGDWWLADAAAVFFGVATATAGWSKLTNFWKRGYDPVVFVAKDSYMWQAMSNDDCCKQGEYVYESFAKDPSEVTSNFAKWRKAADALDDEVGQNRSIDLSALTSEELALKWKRLADAIQLHWEISLVLDGLHLYTERKLFPQFMKETGLPKKEAMEAFAALAAVEAPSFLSREQAKLLQLCIEVAEDPVLLEAAKKKSLGKHAEFAAKAGAHADAFFYKKSTYRNTPEYETRDVIALIEEETAKPVDEIRGELKRLENLPKQTRAKREETLSKLRLSEFVLKSLELSRLLAEWQDDRKQASMTLMYGAVQLMKEISKRLGWAWEDVACLTPNEVPEVLRGNKKVSRKELQERHAFSALVASGGRATAFFGDDAELLYAALMKKSKHETLQLEGMTASLGGSPVVRARCRIVNDPAQDPFEEGEVLVTSMTRPEFVPLMKKAAAIVTNEGGLTCHAAIVAREFNLPCVVGTKHATRTFKTGELLEVNTRHGKVTKIQ
ncbi:MAG: PEP-utilizing enzyme [Candidatus Micrarchaeota archaeon]